jgi:hypothetical protein
MLWVSQLKKKIDEASKQMRNITQQIEQPEEQHCKRNLCHEDNNCDDFLYDDDFPLAIELQATTWPPLYSPTQLSMHDSLLDLGMAMGRVEQKPARDHTRWCNSKPAPKPIGFRVGFGSLASFTYCILLSDNSTISN